ncbi:hypothetical protein GCM10025792_55270 [Pseudonocardia tropica]|nr:hypothetical protein CFP66_30185 [Pseudonocardia sp. MH-G8]
MVELMNSQDGGGGRRPLETEQDRQAEQVRALLRAAGCAEFGENHGGFVVEPGPDGELLVACSDGPGLDLAAEEQHYRHLLTTAGYSTSAGLLDDGSGLRVVSQH